MKTIAIIGTNGLPAKYGGFETLADQLVQNFDKKTHRIIVYCSKTPKKLRHEYYNGAQLIYFPFKANGWQSLIYDFLSITHALFKASDLIILGFSGAFAFPINKIFKKNIIFNIGGIEWKKVRGSKLTSKIEISLKKYMEKLCVLNSNTVIIDNLYFEDYILEKYKRKPILAEYGGDHTKILDVTKEMAHNYPFLYTNYALSVSRAQEDMNIHILIEKLFSENANKYKNIILLEAIYDPIELDVVRSHTSLYIHSHSLCGTAPSLVEAMSLNIPVISFDAQTNRYTTENKTLFFKDSLSLIKILKDIDDNKLLEIKEKMFKIARSRYTWKRISNIYENKLS